MDVALLPVAREYQKHTDDVIFKHGEVILNFFI